LVALPTSIESSVTAPLNVASVPSASALLTTLNFVPIAPPLTSVIAPPIVSAAALFMLIVLAVFNVVDVTLCLKVELPLATIAKTTALSLNVTLAAEGQS